MSTRPPESYRRCTIREPSLKRSKYAVLFELMRNERHNHRELVALQSRKLRRLLRHACENVPFYGRRFSDAGLAPEDIRSAEDLDRLPIVDKTELRDQPLEDLIDRRVELSSLIERNTSGSTGLPLRFFIDRNFDAYCKAQYLRPYLTNGRSVFDRVLRLTVTPSGSRRWFQRLGLMRERRIVGDARPQTLLKVFLETRPDILQGYPSRLVSLAEAIDRVRPSFRSPRQIFSDSELLTSQVRKQIEQTLGAPVIDVFGSYETDIIGYECEQRAGYHLAIDCVVPEIVADDKAAAPGEPGELVCTVLGNFAMPLIRYRLGDVVAADSKPCPCGRGLPLMNKIEGRSVDFVLWRDGTRESPMQFLEKFDRIADFALEYQVLQTDYDQFQVTIVPRNGLREHDRDYLAGAIREQCPQAEITVIAAERIPRPASGKHRAFRCDVATPPDHT